MVLCGTRFGSVAAHRCSSTLFLCDPEDYDGGELVVEDTYGTHEVKFPGRDLILPLDKPAPGRAGHTGRAVCSFSGRSMAVTPPSAACSFEMGTAITSLRTKQWGNC